MRNNQNYQTSPAASDTAQWFCITANPNCQARAALELYALGFRTFLPKIRKWATHARVRKAVEKPLLGRYLFVEVDQPRQSFWTVRSANGVEGFVSNPDPIAIPARYVENFRMRYMDGEWDFVRTDAPCPWFDKNGKMHWRQNDPLQAGARIKIVEGEFSNMLATVTHRRGHRIDFKLHGENRYGRLNDCSVRAA
jgi:transcription antitermination factor NusG